MTKARNIAEFADDLSVSNGEVSIADLKPSQSMMFRNKIINGNFDIWQRGTSQTTDGYGSADRWISNQNVSTKTASQQSFANGQTDVPGNPKYYWRHVVTSGNSVDSLIAAEQRIESVQTLAGQTATLSFWAKADSNKNISTELIQSFGFGGSSTLNTIEVRTYNLTTSWQKFTATVSIPSISGKTIGTNGNDCLVLLIWLDAGSVFNSRTNSLGNQSGTFDIAQVQLEKGPVATPFEHRPLAMELSLCQRYYAFFRAGGGMYWSNGNAVTTASYPVEMRDTPQSVTVNSVKTDYPVNSTWAAARITKQGFEITRSSGTSYNYVVADWTANAEL